MGEEGLTMVEVRQIVAHMSEPMKELEALVLSGRFHHDGNPVLAWMVSNVVAHRDNKDNIYPKKERPENKIDGVVAVIMATRPLDHAADRGALRVRDARGAIAMRRAQLRRYLPDLVDIVAILGAIAIVRGIAQIHPPSAWITAGAFALTAAVLVARKETSR
jgi:hypothetical protein